MTRCASTQEVIRADQIRHLNDVLRTTGSGGRTMLSAGIAALPEDRRAAVMLAVSEFAAFDQNNDPHGEHDCAMVHVAGLQVLWKVDYYNLAMDGLSPDPADARITCRALTIMQSDEY